ncbi:MAG: malto-oligosyltrehalose synthase [Planctomycetia bacterium]|nr:malto-oligosyltrehalose synthase [Planctomycetia bacterium]
MEESAPTMDLLEPLIDQVVQRVQARRVVPAVTYRVQFRDEWTFDDATAIVPYLHELGVSHVYASPYMRARAGSPHGYDVCDPNQLNPAFGSEESYRGFIAALRAHGMGHIVDVVPNHMAASCENPWWRDVLENGPNSPYSGYFDIDWHPVKDELENKVLLPQLGSQYGDALERGQLKIEHHEGRFEFHYFQHRLPLGPKTTIPLLTHRLEELNTALGAGSESFDEYQSIVTAIQHLPAQTSISPKATVERQREKEVIKRRLRDLEAREPKVAEFLAENVRVFNGREGEPESFEALDKLLQAQTYRLCHWRAASDEINYRRFFDINDLAALCMEKSEVFHSAHELIGKLLASGEIDGLRIDHVDGLFSPEQYLWRLQWNYLGHLLRDELGKLSAEETAALAESIAGAKQSPENETEKDAASSVEESASPALSVAVEALRQLCDRLGLRQPKESDWTAIFGRGAAEAGRDSRTASGNDLPKVADHGNLQQRLPLFVVVEKILGPHEPLPETWPVAGTTGYDFTNQLNSIFVHPQGYGSVEKHYKRFTAEERSFATIARECKRLIVRSSMSSELQMLAHRLNRISEQHRKSRDFTLNALRYALREVLACFPVYRTYPGPEGVSDRDRRFVNYAVASAKRHNRTIDPATFDFIRDVLLLRHPSGLSEEAKQAREHFAGLFQQVTSPIMAKGVEDTAFYVYFPLLSANEVGGDPASAAHGIEEFHQQNAGRRRRGLQSLLATSTHDTKRSEDVRARINVLSEMPRPWRTAVNRWNRLNRRRRTKVDGVLAPTRNDEYLFYQSLTGMWPTGGELDDATRTAVIERMQAYMEKATHESKQQTSWINPNPGYDQAVRDFVAACLTPDADNRFLPEFLALQRKIVQLGLYTALSQVALKLLSPGVPDIFQGQEVWDFSLVDPDNRRPVDYARRTQLLQKLKADFPTEVSHRAEFAASLAKNPADDRLKLFATWKLIELRRKHETLFAAGRYVPLSTSGRAAEHIVAFAWQPTSDHSAEHEAGAEDATRIVVVVPRWWGRLTEAAAIDGVVACVGQGERVWADTTVELPAGFPRTFVNHLTGRQVHAKSDLFRLKEVLDEFPIGVFVSEGA